MEKYQVRRPVGCRHRAQMGLALAKFARAALKVFVWVHVPGDVISAFLIFADICNGLHSCWRAVQAWKRCEECRKR